MTPPDSLRILAALLDAGHITADQKRRVERALAAGRDLMQALKDTPLVEPMIFYRAAHGLGATPTPVPEGTLRDDPPQSSHLEGVRRDSSEGINILELELDEDDLPSRRPGATPLPIRKPAAPAVSKPPAAQRAGGIEPPGDPASYVPPVGKLPEFDLRNDEGINTVRIVNEALAISTFEGAAVRVVMKGDSGTLLRFGVSGAQVADEKLDPERADLYSTRLRVMARIQPRTPGTVRRAFHANVDGRSVTGLVESVVENDRAGRVTVWFVKRLA